MDENKEISQSTSSKSDRKTLIARLKAMRDIVVQKKTMKDEMRQNQILNAIEEIKDNLSSFTLAAYSSQFKEGEFTPEEITVKYISQQVANRLKQQGVTDINYNEIGAMVSANMPENLTKNGKAR